MNRKVWSRGQDSNLHAPRAWKIYLLSAASANSATPAKPAQEELGRKKQML